MGRDGVERGERSKRCSIVLMHHAAMCLTAEKWEQRAVRRRGRRKRRDYMIFRTCRP